MNSLHHPGESDENNEFAVINVPDDQQSLHEDNISSKKNSSNVYGCRSNYILIAVILLFLHVAHHLHFESIRETKMKENDEFNRVLSSLHEKEIASAKRIEDSIKDVHNINVLPNLDSIKENIRYTGLPQYMSERKSSDSDIPTNLHSSKNIISPIAVD